MDELIAAKVEQAAGLLREQNMPAWIVQFGRETHDHPSPVQHLVVGTSVTWPAAFLLMPDGRAEAIVGTGDVANVTGLGVYHVTGYVKDVGPPLRDLLARFDPSRVAVSYSVDDDNADSITHGMYVLLQSILKDTPYAARLETADTILMPLRARKLPVEVRRIRAAIETTLELFDEIESMLKPGITERQIQEAVHASIRRRGLVTAWDVRYDPVVNFGPESSFGHAGPGDIVLEPGMLVHVDLGVQQERYCSDLQRMWYVAPEGKDGPPDDVQRAFDTVVRSLQVGFEALKPGVLGWEVDAAARAVLTGAGYPEPEFSLGHQLGQSTHDGGGLLGPRWPRYGNRPYVPVEAGNVFTLEYALQSSAGIIGVEEDVLVTESGAEFLTAPQTTLRIVW